MNVSVGQPPTHKHWERVKEEQQRKTTLLSAVMGETPHQKKLRHKKELKELEARLKKSKGVALTKSTTAYFELVRIEV